MSAGRPRGARAWPAALHLVAFALIIALPLLVLLGCDALPLGGAGAAAARTRDRPEARRRWSPSIDRDIERRIAVLQTLATAPALVAGGLARLPCPGQASLGGRNYLVLIDADGRQLINTYVPYGEAPRSPAIRRRSRRCAGRYGRSSPTCSPALSSRAGLQHLHPDHARRPAPLRHEPRPVPRGSARAAAGPAPGSRLDRHDLGPQRRHHGALRAT